MDEASSFDFGHRHLVFLETVLTIFGKQGDAEGETRVSSTNNSQQVASVISINDDVNLDANFG